MQSIKEINLYILIASSHALLHTTSKTNDVSCHYLRTPSMTVTAQIIPFYFLNAGELKKKMFCLRETMETSINKRKLKGGFYKTEHHSFYSCDNEYCAFSTAKLVVFAHGRTAYIFSSVLFQDVFFCGKESLYFLISSAEVDISLNQCSKILGTSLEVLPHDRLSKKGINPAYINGW